MKELYEEMLGLQVGGGAAVLVTVVDKSGHGPAVPGAKMLVLSDGRTIGTVGGGTLEHRAVKEAGQVLQNRQNRLKKYILSPDNDVLDNELVDGEGAVEGTGMLCGGSMTLFYDYTGAGVNLYVFGAGHIGRALVYHLANLDYHVTLLDCRPGMAEEVGGVGRRVYGDYEAVLGNEAVPENSYFIIASHSHRLDYVILKRIYQAGWNPAYIGLIASKRKAPLMVERLKGELGNGSHPLNLDVLYTPVGLDIGGQKPHEIAISIIAELQAVRYGKAGNRHMVNVVGGR